MDEQEWYGLVDEIAALVRFRQILEDPERLLREISHGSTASQHVWTSDYRNLFHTIQWYKKLPSEEEHTNVITEYRKVLSWLIEVLQQDAPLFTHVLKSATERGLDHQTMAPVIHAWQEVYRKMPPSFLHEVEAEISLVEEKDWGITWELLDGFRNILDERPCSPLGAILDAEVIETLRSNVIIIQDNRDLWEALYPMLRDEPRGEVKCGWVGEAILYNLGELWGRRREAAIALGFLRDPSAVDPLLNIAFCHEIGRLEAIEALGEIGDKRAINGLKQVPCESWGEDDEELRKAVDDAIMKILNSFDELY